MAACTHRYTKQPHSQTSSACRRSNASRRCAGAPGFNNRSTRDPHHGRPGGCDDVAWEELHEASRLAPDDADIPNQPWTRTGAPGENPGRSDQLHEALRLNADSAEAHNNLGLALLASGKARESIPEFEAALPPQTGATSCQRKPASRPGTIKFGQIAAKSASYPVRRGCRSSAKRWRLCLIR